MRAWIPLVVGLVMPACAGVGTDRRSGTPGPRSAFVRERVEHPAGASEDNAVVESEVVLATGRLAPESLAPPEVER